MTPEKVKLKISELAVKHKAVSDEPEDLWEAEIYESSAVKLISDYCESMGYQVNGFPKEKKNLVDVNEEDEDFFSSERYVLYVDHLTVTHEDVADLAWFYTSSFFKDSFQDKQSFIESVKAQLEDDDFYDVEL